MYFARLSTALSKDFVENCEFDGIRTWAITTNGNPVYSSYIDCELSLSK